jgi:hypothetical protein
MMLKISRPQIHNLHEPSGTWHKRNCICRIANYEIISALSVGIARYIFVIIQRIHWECITSPENDTVHSRKK